MNISYPCPVCDGVTVTKKTFKVLEQDLHVRRRYCKQCDYAFSTYQFSEKILENHYVSQPGPLRGSTTCVLNKIDEPITWDQPPAIT